MTRRQNILYYTMDAYLIQKSVALRWLLALAVLLQSGIFNCCFYHQGSLIMIITYSVFQINECLNVHEYFCFFVSQITLCTYVTILFPFNVISALPGAVQVVRTADPLTLYLTPVGRSYMCNLPKSIKIFDDKKTARVTITLNRVQIQPFAAMNHRQYGMRTSLS